MTTASIVGLVLYGAQRFGIAFGVGGITTAVIMLFSHGSADDSHVRVPIGMVRFGWWTAALSGLFISIVRLIGGDISGVFASQSLFYGAFVVLALIFGLPLRRSGVRRRWISFSVYSGATLATWYAILSLQMLHADIAPSLLMGGYAAVLAGCTLASVGITAVSRASSRAGMCVEAQQPAHASAISTLVPTAQTPVTAGLTLQTTPITHSSLTSTLSHIPVEESLVIAEMKKEIQELNNFKEREAREKLIIKKEAEEIAKREAKAKGLETEERIKREKEAEERAKIELEAKEKEVEKMRIEIQELKDAKEMEAKAKGLETEERIKREMEAEDARRKESEALKIKEAIPEPLGSLSATIILNGPEVQIIKAYDPYVELGAVVSDVSDSGLFAVVNNKAVDIKHVGTYSVEYNVTSSDGKRAFPAKRTVQVIKREITITADAKTKQYGNDDPKLTYVVSGDFLDNVQGVVGELSRAEGKNVGSYIITQGTVKAPDIYNVHFVSAPLSIDKKPITVTADAQNKIYGEPEPKYSFSYSSDFVFDDNASSIENPPVCAVHGSHSDVGEYTINVSGGSDRNYLLNYVSGILSIARKTITAVVNVDPKTYDGTTDASVQVLLQGVVSGDIVTAKHRTALFDDAQAGDNRVVTVSGIGISGKDAVNYSIAGIATAVAHIAKRPLTVTAKSADKIYDGTTSAEVSFSDNRVLGDIIDVSGEAAFVDKFTGNKKAVFISNIKISGRDSDNYSIGNPSETVETVAAISPRTLSVTAVGIDRIYDSTVNATVMLSDDRLPGDVIMIRYELAVFVDKHAGFDKEIVVQGISISGSDARNYKLKSNILRTLANISPRPIVVNANSVTKAYGALDNLTYTAEGIIGNDTLAGSLSHEAGSNAGVYGISRGDLNSADYTITFHGAVLTVFPRQITVTAVPNHKIYDGSVRAVALPVISGSIADGDVAGFVETYDNAEVGSNKTLIPSGIVHDGNDGKNYCIEFVKNTEGVIEKAPILEKRLFVNSEPPVDTGLVGKKIEMVAPMLQPRVVGEAPVQSYRSIPAPVADTTEVVSEEKVPAPIVAPIKNVETKELERYVPILPEIYPGATAVRRVPVTTFTAYVPPFAVKREEVPNKSETFTIMPNKTTVSAPVPIPPRPTPTIMPAKIFVPTRPAPVAQKPAQSRPAPVEFRQEAKQPFKLPSFMSAFMAGNSNFSVPTNTIEQNRVANKAPTPAPAMHTSEKAPVDPYISKLFAQPPQRPMYTPIPLSPIMPKVEAVQSTPYTPTVQTLKMTPLATFTAASEDSAKHVEVTISSVDTKKDKSPIHDFEFKGLSAMNIMPKNQAR